MSLPFFCNRCTICILKKYLPHLIVFSPCWHCKNKQATDAYECTKCGVEFPVKEIHYFNWKPIILSSVLLLLTPAIGLPSLAISIVYSCCTSHTERIMHDAPIGGNHHPQRGANSDSLLPHNHLTHRNNHHGSNTLADGNNLSITNNIHFHSQNGSGITNHSHDSNNNSGNSSTISNNNSSDDHKTTVPCGHFGMCEKCALQVHASSRKCPFCQGTIKSLQKTFAL